MNKFNRISNIVIETIKGAAQSKNHATAMTMGVSVATMGLTNIMNGKIAHNHYTKRFSIENEVVQYIVRESGKVKKIGAVMVVVGGAVAVGAVAHYYVNNKDEVANRIAGLEERRD